MKRLTTIFSIIILFSAAQFASAQRPNITVTKFRDSALASTWCPYDTTVVAYDLLQPDGYYNIYIANVGPNNTFLSERCFTCGNKALPGKNVAQPIFHPSGKYMLFTAEDSAHAGSSANSIPGIGLYNDIYVETMDGKHTYRLTHKPDTGASAIIETYFSPNGKEIMWDEMTENVAVAGKQEFGFWVIKTAPFIMSDTVRGPYIDSAHIKVYMPGNVNAFNEPYGWSPDGSKIIFASDYNQFWVWDDQIYTIDTNTTTNKAAQMTSTAHDYPYTEHAFYSTDGKHIVWMTNEDIDTGSSVGGDDWWIMNSDTTNQMRLTYFNDTTSSYWTGSTHINCHGAFCPGINKFIGDVTGSKPVQTNPALSIGAAYIITLNYLNPTVPTGINPDASPPQCTLYPNPANNFIKVNITGTTALLYYSIYDVLGNKITESELQNDNTKINVRNLSGGIYFIRIYNATTTINQKFVIERN